MALDEASAALVAHVKGTTAGPLSLVYAAPVRPGWSGVDVRPRPNCADGRDTLIAAAGGSIAVRITAPEQRPRAVIVFYRESGWALGTIADSDLFSQTLAARTQCAVLSVGYRLAPEYRYPTAVEDAWSAAQWAARHMSDIAGERVPLIVAGEGTGGCLAAVVARRSCEDDDQAICLQVLLCPVTDCDFESTSYTDPANQLLLDRDTMIWLWDMYAPDAAARRHADAAPLQAMFLSGLPPAAIVTAEHDVLRDEGELYAMRLVQAGVPVEHQRFAGQVHGFTSMIGTLPGAGLGIDFVAAAISRQIDRALVSS